MVCKRKYITKPLKPLGAEGYEISVLKPQETSDKTFTYFETLPQETLTKGFKNEKPVKPTPKPQKKGAY